MARQAAGSAFVPHKADLAPPFAGLGYDAFRAIRPRQSPLGTRTGFAFDLLPPGFVYQTPVTIAQVTDGLSREIPFSIDEFEFDQRYFDPQTIAAARQAGPDLGYSGFRLRSRINRVDVLDEFAVFQGASYFRAIARNMVYGLSARGLAIGTGSPTGEEFPVFRAFWIVTPAPADQKVLVRALLDSPSCAGAFEFEITPGETTAMQIRCTLFPRSEITEIGIAPLTSMYLFGPGRRARVDDFRNSVHDSEGLQMITGDGERLWRPLNNPRRVQISAFQDNNPKGFGLSQRHRDFDHYQDDEAHYEKRPSAWVEPIDDWGEGAVVLVEIPTDSEFNDNIVAFWRPRAPIGPTDVGHQIAYRLLWSASAPDSGPLGRVIATRTGVAMNDGNRTAIERTHYMESSKLFVPVDRPFWLDKDEDTGRDVMSMTLTDRMTRGTYLLDDGPDKPAVICLSYTWCDDSLKWLPLSANERMEVMLKSLGEIYPKVDIRKHIIGNPVTVSWENEPYFMGAFKANLPGHYRYQRRLFTHFMQDRLPADKRGIFLAGDDISWTAGWAEGAVQTALNAVWGVMHQLGGATDPTNPGPGDVYDEIAPVELPED
ncbi:MAG: glucan biosynthesis protein [Defluviimonas sp.]|nr:glucan biosynthesis protein [Defluviimonas sp.]